MVASVETRPVTRGLLLLIGDAGRRIRGPERFVAVLAAPGFDSGRDAVRRRANYTATGPLAKSEKGRGQVRGPRGAVGDHRHRRRAGEPWIHLDTADVPLG